MKKDKTKIEIGEEEYTENKTEKVQKRKKRFAMCRFSSDAGEYDEKLMFDEGCDLEVEYKELIEEWNQEHPENKHRTFVSAEWI